ncbi:MAG: hypothetical protein ACKV2V_09035 [Blastocatellia bacterium]
MNNIVLMWGCMLIGGALFALTTWLDNLEIGRFTELAGKYSAEAEKMLWIRIITRQVAAMCLVLLVDLSMARMAEMEGVLILELGRFFLAMAEAANLLRLHYYYQLVRETARRAYAMEVLRGRRRRQNRFD